MDDRTKTVAATGIIIGFFFLVIIIIVVMLTGKKVLSPVPDEGAIKIIFLTPTPGTQVPASVSGTLSPTKEDR